MNAKFFVKNEEINILIIYINVVDLRFFDPSRGRMFIEIRAFL
jgi:hypothetical protein